MRRLALSLAAALLTLAVAPPVASAAFGVSDFKAEVRKSATPGDLQTQAGSVPFEGVTDFTVNTNVLGMPDGNVRNIRVDLPPGLVSNPQATPKCTDAQFPSCPAATQLGTDEIYTAGGIPAGTFPVYNMVPRAGQVSLFSFNSPVGRTDIAGGMRPGDHGLFFTISDVPQNANLVRSVLTFWGTPANQNGGGGPKTFFIRLPTACLGPQTTTLTVQSWAGETATKTSTTPTGTTGCDKLAFAPKVTANAIAARAGHPTGLTVTITQADGEANIHSTAVTLPKQFGTRLDTLAQACPEATFTADPSKCPAGAKVGTAKAVTPLLASPMTGDVYFEAHSGKLPTLEAVLKGPGITLDLSGTIAVGNGITSTFEQVPDLPVSEFTLALPAGAHSALAATAGLCGAPVTIGSSIVGWNGKKVDGVQDVGIAGCGVAIVSAKVKRSVAIVRLRAPSAGVVALRGKGLAKTKARFTAAGTKTVKLTVAKAGAAALRKARARHRKLTLHVKAAFSPAAGATAAGAPVTRSSATAKLVFK